MSPRLPLVALALIAACATDGPTKRGKREPRNAKEKQRLEAKKDPDVDGGQKWGQGWRYQGDRNDCFYVVGKTCFKTQNAACQAAHCKVPKKCDIDGAGPATVKCK